MDRWTGGPGWTGNRRQGALQPAAVHRTPPPLAALSSSHTAAAPRTRGEHGSSHVPRSVRVRRKRRRSSQRVSARELARRCGSLPADAPMIGIQAGAVSFVDEGTTSRPRQPPARSAASTRSSSPRSPTAAASADGSRAASALPDHGKQEYDDAPSTAATSRRRIRSTTANTSIAPEKAPDHRSYDVLADVLPAAHARGMKVICWFEDVIGGRRARLRSGARSRAHRPAVHVRLLAQSEHAQLLARAGRGLPALVRRRRPDVGQRAAGAARQRARRESRRRRRRRRHRVLLPVLHRRGEEARASTSIARATATLQLARWANADARRRRSPPTARSSRSGGCS